MPAPVISIGARAWMLQGWLAKSGKNLMLSPQVQRSMGAGAKRWAEGMAAIASQGRLALYNRE
jgi:hypothetical protein